MLGFVHVQSVSALLSGGGAAFLCVQGTHHSSPVCRSVWVGLCCRRVGSRLAPALGVAEEGVVGVSAAGHGPALASGATS